MRGTDSVATRPRRCHRVHSCDAAASDDHDEGVDAIFPNVTLKLIFGTLSHAPHAESSRRAPYFS